MALNAGPIRVFCLRFWWFTFLTVCGVLLFALPFLASRSADEGPLIRTSANQPGRPSSHVASRRARSTSRLTFGGNEHCTQDYTTGKYGSVLWPTTEVDHASKKMCPYGPLEGKDDSWYGIAWAYRYCVLTHSGPLWYEPDYSRCAEENCDDFYAERAAKAAENMTSDTERIDGDTFKNATDLIEQAFRVALHNVTVGNQVLKAMSNLLATQPAVLEQCEESSKHQLFVQMERFASEVDLERGEGINAGNASMELDNLHLVVRRLPLVSRVPPARDSAGAAEGLEACSIPGVVDADMLRFSPHFACMGADGNAAPGNVEVRLPQEALTKAMEGVSAEDCVKLQLRLRFVAMRNAHLVRPPGLNSGQQCVVSSSISWDMERVGDSESTGRTATPSPEIDELRRDIHIRDLVEPVQIKMPFSLAGASHVCAYYDLKAREWKFDGMTARTTSEEGVTCEATHLTPFTLLLDPYPRRELGDLVFTLDTVGYVGSSLSVLGLLITIVSYLSFRVGGDRWGRTLVQLSLSLLLLHVAYLASNLKGTVPPAACMAIAVFVHLFLLTAFFWMLFLALLLYQLLVTVFEPASTKFMLKRLFAAWGIPVILVTGCAGMNPWYYKDTHQDYCVTSATDILQHLLFVLVPCGLVMIGNLLIFIRVSIVLLKQRRPPGHQVERTATSAVTWAQLRGVVGVAFLLGVTWPLSPLATSSAVMQLASSALNSSQGVVLFVTRVLTHKEVRRAWRRYFGQCCKRMVPISREFHSSATYSVSDKKSFWSRLGFSGHNRTVASSEPENSAKASQTSCWRCLCMRRFAPQSLDGSAVESKCTSELSENKSNS